MSILPILLALAPALFAAEPVVLQAGRGTFRLGTHLELLRDDSGTLTVDNVTSGSHMARFYDYGWDRVPNFGYSPATLWTRLRIHNPLPFQKEMILELDNPLLSDARVFLVHEGQAVTESRSIKHRVFLFPLSIRARSTLEVYLRVKSEGSITLPLTLFRPDAFAREDQNTQFILGIYYGLVFVMILYNLLLFFGLRERTYLYYSITLLCIHGMLQFSLNGLARTYLSSADWWSSSAIPFFTSAGIFWALLFCREFLNTSRRTPEIHRVTNVLLWTALALCPLSLLLPYRISVTVLILHGTVSLSCAIAAGYYSWRENFAPARTYLLAWLTVLAGTLILNLKNWGFLPITAFTEYSSQAGLAAGAILLALALSDRFYSLRQDRYTAQQKAMEQERMARKAEETLLLHLQQMEELKRDFLSMAIEDPGRTLDALVEKILTSLARILKFESGFITVLDKFERHVSASMGEMPPYVAEFVPRAFQILRRFRVPDDFFSEIDSISDLRDNTRLPFRDLALAGDYAQNASNIRAFLARLAQDQFRFLIPLSFQNELFGYIVTGQTPREQLTESDIRLLEAFRLSAALAVRNAMLYDEVTLLKGKAEGTAHQLSEYIAEFHKARQHQLTDKTIVYLSKTMTDVVDRTQSLAARNQPMLILGETGTGKEMIASLIHETSSRAEGPFIAVNCAAIPASLWESEIFGHMKGAFTDAKADREGRIEQAAGGTIFFDEIGEMPMEMQPKMLRLIQERKFQRVGGTKDLSAECRFIFATHRDLEEMQARGAFRQDLYYRINVFQIRIPPLRERLNDVPALAAHFLQKYCAEMGFETKQLSEQAMEALCRFNWPGNVRELENAIIQAIVNARTELIRTEDLPIHIVDFRKIKKESRSGEPADSQASQARSSQPSLNTSGWNGQTLADALDEYARVIIHAALSAANGNKVEAAKKLGLKRATFYNKLKDLGIPV